MVVRVITTNLTNLRKIPNWWKIFKILVANLRVLCRTADRPGC